MSTIDAVEHCTSPCAWYESRVTQHDGSY